MPTINQVVKGIRSPKRKIKLRLPPLFSGTVIKTPRINPCKPNSANRLVAKTKAVLVVRKRIGNGPYLKKEISRVFTVRVPGEKTPIKEHDKIYFYRRNTVDLRGISYCMQPGVKGLNSVPGRKNGRSRVGTKAPAKSAKKK
jgi:small subunit ribosomal protein S12